jgi:hypothetical protein
MDHRNVGLITRPAILGARVLLRLVARGRLRVFIAAPALSVRLSTGGTVSSSEEECRAVLGLFFFSWVGGKE